MKKILDLDIGTNCLGWTFIDSNFFDNSATLDSKIIQLGSRIIPMDADAMSKFETVSVIASQGAKNPLSYYLL